MDMIYIIASVVWIAISVVDLLLKNHEWTQAITIALLFLILAKLEERRN